MAIVYGLSKKGIAGGKGLYYAHVKSAGIVTLDELCEDIACRCSLRKPLLQAAVIALAEGMCRHLACGRIVDLGDIGRFRISCGGRGVERPEHFLARRDITSAKVVYRPGREVKRGLDCLEFKRG